MYHVLKDFAGPVATIIAATVAVFFTWRIGRGQLQIARRQADTALDQLRYNLFEKRYAIYEAARRAIAIAFAKRDDDKMPEELNELFLRFEESRFFFLPDICLFLEQLQKDIRNFLQENYNDRQSTKGKVITQGLRQVLLEREAKLRELENALYVTQQNLPKTFEHALAFPQLTVPRHH
jgi:hypothetical protein